VRNPATPLLLPWKHGITDLPILQNRDKIKIWPGVFYLTVPVISE
jgi:hypothetical protein